MEIASNLCQTFACIHKIGKIFSPGYATHVKEFESVLAYVESFAEEPVSHRRMKALNINTPWVKSYLFFGDAFFSSSLPVAMDGTYSASIRL